jgi:hypothetical protein
VRSVSFIVAAVIAGASAMTSACAGGQQVSGSPVAPSPPARSAPATPAACHGASLARPGTPLTLRNNDNGRRFCLAQGGSVLVMLKGTAARRWAPIHASSGALIPEGNGRLALAIGVTGAYFRAVRPGVVKISSARRACSPASPSAASCGAELAYRVTVVIPR